MTTRIAFVRHSQVDNPQQILYGRLDGFDYRRVAADLSRRFGDQFTTSEDPLI